MKFTRDNLKVFLLGVLVAAMMVFLMGASIGLEKEVGRYSVAGAANDKGIGFIILDTATGEYQIVSPKDGSRGRFF